MKCLTPNVFRSIYRTYLKSKAKEDNVIGDLARDSFRSNWRGQSIESLRKHLFKCNAESFINKIFLASIKEYLLINNEEDL